MANKDAVYGGFVASNRVLWEAANSQQNHSRKGIVIAIVKLHSACKDYLWGSLRLKDECGFS